MIYQNDTQLINETADYIIKRHLQCSNSLDNRPGKDFAGYGYSELLDAYVEAKFGYDVWDNMEEHELMFQVEIIKALHKKACQVADKKWQAAMVLLGMEE